MCVPLQRSRINIREQRGLRMQVSVYTRRTAPAYSVTAHPQHTCIHCHGPVSTPIAQGLVYDINAPHASGLRESKHAYGRNSAPIVQGLVYDTNAPHAFGLRESKPNAMHSYGRSSAPITQGLVYDINAPHAYRCRCRVVEAHTVSLRASTGKPTGAIGKRASRA